MANLERIENRLLVLDRPAAVLGVGFPGSGKTTFLKKLADSPRLQQEEFKVVRICPDDIREELTGNAEDQSANQEVWKTAYQRARGALSSEQSVIIDATHAEAWRRPDDTQRYRGYGAAAVVTMWFHISRLEAVRRNSLRERRVPSSVITRMHRALQQTPPSTDEGFDDIIHVNLQ